METVREIEPSGPQRLTPFVRRARNLLRASCLVLTLVALWPVPECPSSMRVPAGASPLSR